MRGVALVAPVVVLALVHLLQRLEDWALDDHLSANHPRRQAASAELGTQIARRRARVLHVGSDSEGAEHG